MKKISILICLFTGLGFSRVTALSDTEMKAWQSYMTPGDIHKMIAASDGDWNEEITMWMDPAAPTAKYTASAKNEMIMGGRYQLSKTKGEMMGMPFEGMSLVGYDNAKKTFTSVWIDNLGTGITTMEGKWDESTRSITFTGNMVDPVSGKEVWTKQVIKFIDNDTQQMEMYDKKNGTETKTMEIKFTRKK